MLLVSIAKVRLCSLAHQSNGPHPWPYQDQPGYVWQRYLWRVGVSTACSGLLRNWGSASREETNNTYMLKTYALSKDLHESSVTTMAPQFLDDGVTLYLFLSELLFSPLGAPWTLLWVPVILMHLHLSFLSSMTSSCLNLNVNKATKNCCKTFQILWS